MLCVWLMNVDSMAVMVDPGDVRLPDIIILACRGWCSGHTHKSEYTIAHNSSELASHVNSNPIFTSVVLPMCCYLFAAIYASLAICANYKLHGALTPALQLPAGEGGWQHASSPQLGQSCRYTFRSSTIFVVE